MNSRNRQSQSSPRSFGKSQTTQKRHVCWQSVTSCFPIAFWESFAIQKKPLGIFDRPLNSRVCFLTIRNVRKSAFGPWGT